MAHWRTPAWASWPAQECQCSVLLLAGMIDPEPDACTPPSACWPPTEPPAAALPAGVAWLEDGALAEQALIPRMAAAVRTAAAHPVRPGWPPVPRRPATRVIDMYPIMPELPRCAGPLTDAPSATGNGLRGVAVALLERLAVLGHDDVREFLDRGVLAALVEGDPAALQQVHPVDDREHLAVVVRDDDDRHALLLQVADQIEDHRALLDAHGGQRLVEEQDLGVGEHRAGHRDGLPLTAGQAGHLDVHRLQRLDPHGVQVLLGHPSHDLVAEQRPAHRLAVEEHVVVHGQLVDQREVLVHDVDA